MQKIIEDVLNANRMNYLLYSKGLNTTAQIKKFEALRLKKSKQVFIVARKPKSKAFFGRCLEENGLEGMEDITYAILRGENIYLASEDLEESELREEIYDDIINCGELYICEGCKTIIRSQKMKCQSCEDDSYLCTFCFAKIIMSSSSTANCPKCHKQFLKPEAMDFLEELVNIYRSNPRDLFTLLQKKKKQLPPSLKNIGKVIQSALGEAKARDEKLDFQ